MSQRSSSVVAGAAAVGSAFGGLLAADAFVASGGAPAAAAGAVAGQPPALRGGAPRAGARAGEEPAGALSGAAAAAGLAGAAVVAALARGGASTRGRGVGLRAEPVSAAAAAAVAASKAAAATKAAAAAKGAAKTAGAVSGSAGAGSMAKSAEENKEDPDLADKKLYKKDVGTPEYEAIKKAQQIRNEKDWEYSTGRNPDGNFGNPNAAYRGKADMYDPLDSLSEQWLKEAGQDFNPAYQIGATEPLGYFDPAGFCKRGDEKSFRQYRTAEIKHGRVAMMAALGAVIQHFVKFPGFAGVPSGLAAVNTPPGSYGAILLFAAAGALELGVWTEQEDKAPGNFGDPLGLNNYTEDMRNRELNNGRAAMFAAIGIIAAELVSGKDAVEQLGF